MAGDVQARNAMNAAISGGKPYKSYKKTILGKVLITVLDATNNEREALLLQGDPNRNEEDCYYHTWSEKEDIFFRTAIYNRDHLKAGRVIEIPVEEKKEPEKTMETSSDAELEDIINSKFLALQQSLNKTDSEAVLFRMLHLSRKLEKSDKIVRAIEARLSEVQEEKYAAPKNLVVER